MVDPHLQERFARGCTDAAFGYSAATTAAYAAFLQQVFDFWAGLLAPAKPEPKAPETLWGWPVPALPQAPSPPLPFFPFFWTGVPQRQDAHAGFPLAGFPFAASAPSPFQAWLGMFPMAAAPPQAWSMAFMLMASGMPHSVAWPTAEANVAAMDAVDAAAVSVRRVFSSYRSEGGHSVAQQYWPPTQLMMLAALIPLNLGIMLASLRMA